MPSREPERALAAIEGKREPTRCFQCTHQPNGYEKRRARMFLVIGHIRFRQQKAKGRPNDGQVITVYRHRRALHKIQRKQKYWAATA